MCVMLGFVVLAVYDVEVGDPKKNMSKAPCRNMGERCSVRDVIQQGFCHFSKSRHRSNDHVHAMSCPTPATRIAIQRRTRIGEHARFLSCPSHVKKRQFSFSIMCNPTATLAVVLADVPTARIG